MSSNPTSLAGRGVIVTGGNSGIGLAMAKAFVTAGAQVMISGRRAESNRQALAEFGNGTGSVVAFTGDMGDEATVVRMVAEAETAFGRIDVAIANAGGNDGETAPLIDMDAGMWRRTVTTNLDGAFFLFREAARRMVKAGCPGSLIGVSSVSSIRVTPSLHYSAAKGGLNALITAIAGQLGPYGIRANAILPGFIETPPVTAAMASREGLRHATEQKIPLKRIGAPQDIASLAVFLAGDESNYITAQHIVVDGGLTKTM